ncbi:MAG: S24/S26 family peptidase [Clostridia bacterium]|nr:S24/S26 family peptidase [Clostridia bacterium]
MKRYTFEDILSEKGYLVYTNVGISMLPLLRQRRDIIEIRPLHGRAKKFDVVLYKAGNKYILHRVLKVCPDDYVICGDHNIWREYGITDAQILGVMTRVIRDGKSIYPTNWKYRFYVHLWCDFYHVRAAILYAKKCFGAVRIRLKQLIKNV